MANPTGFLDLPHELVENIIVRAVVSSDDPAGTLTSLKRVCWSMHDEFCRARVVGVNFPLFRALPRLDDAEAREARGLSPAP